MRASCATQVSNSSSKRLSQASGADLVRYHDKANKAVDPFESDDEIDDGGEASEREEETEVEPDAHADA